MMILNFTTFVGETSFGALMNIIFFSESLSQKKIEHRIGSWNRNKSYGP